LRCAGARDAVRELRASATSSCTRTSATPATRWWRFSCGTGISLLAVHQCGDAGRSGWWARRCRRARELFAGIAANLAQDLDTVAERTIAQIYQELPSYATVPFAGLRASIQRYLDTALRALRSGVPPRPDELRASKPKAQWLRFRGFPSIMVRC